METEEKIVGASVGTGDLQLDLTLRPRTFSEYIGQGKAKENLKLFIAAAKKRGEILEHILIHGAPGLGKTTLANVIANELGVNIKITSGPAIERAGDLASILTNLAPGDILFIDEIHRLSRLIEEVLYPAMEDFALDLIIGKGPSAKTLRLDLPKFTLIGATTRAGALSSPLRDRFGVFQELHFYNQEEIEKIVERSAKILKTKIDKEGLREIAKRSRRTPRVANRILKRVRDFALIKADDFIDRQVALEALKMFGVDELGLDRIDRVILEVIIEKFNGGPVGIETISAAVAQDKDTIEDVYEPYLMQIGFLQRTPKGRKATNLAYNHLGIKINSQTKLL